MSEKNLPIKLVLQKATDIQNNTGGGGLKFFGEVTNELQRYKRTKEIYKNTKDVHKYKRKRIKVQKNKKHKRKKSCQKWQLYLHGLVFWLASSTGASSSVTRVTFSALTYPRTIIFRWNIEKTAVRLESSRGINFAIFKLFKLFQYG